MIRVCVIWRTPEEGGRQEVPTGISYAATLRFWPRRSFESKNPYGDDAHHSFGISDRKFVHPRMEYASLTFMDENVEAVAGYAIFTVMEGSKEVAEGSFMGVPGHPSLQPEPAPTLYVAKVPKAWTYLLSLTEEECKAREVKRERPTVPQNSYPGGPYSFAPVNVDDPRPHNNDSRVVEAHEPGADPKFQFGQPIVLVRNEYKPGGYHIETSVGETGHGEITRKIPFDYVTQDGPTVIRIEVEE